MGDPLFTQLLVGLFLWSLASLGAAAAGLAGRPRPFWRSVWLMTAGWGLIDGLIGVYGLATGPLPPVELGPLLRINAGFDGLYIAAGAILLTRPSPRAGGFGLAVLVQGLFLLAFDVAFWLRCEALTP